MRLRRGWSLLEVVVVLALSSALLLVLSRTLAATMRASQHEMARGTSQGVLMTSMSTLERTIQRSSKPGITWQSGLLVIHPQPEGEVPKNPVWEAYWVTFLRQGTDLWMSQVVGAGTQKATLPEAPLLAQMQSAPASGARRLAGEVSQFDYQVSAGPIFTLTLELSVTPPGRLTPEKFRAVRQIFLHTH